MMRKLTLLFVAALVAGGVQAQTTKGTVALTGSIGYTQSKSTKERKALSENYTIENNNYTLSPSVGYFIKDNLELGVSYHLQKYSEENINFNNDYKQILKYDGKGQDYKVYVRQYKYLLEKLALYGTLSAGMSNWKYNNVGSNSGTFLNSYNSKTEYSTFTAALSPGLAFFPSRKVGFSVNLGALEYSRREIDATSISENQQPPQYHEHRYRYKYNTYGLDFSSLNLNFGLTYFIGK